MDAQAITPSQPMSLAANVSLWWQRQAYRNKAAEWSLYFMFVTGFVLWNQFTLPWQFERVVLIVHVLSSLILFPAAVLPFWLSHRRLLKGSQKKLLNITGQILDCLLLACAISGVFLFVVGNRGDDMGYLAYLTHLVSALVITPILIRHAARWSVLAPIWSLIKNKTLK